LEPGSREFFKEHRSVYINDCFAGRLVPRTLPDAGHRARVLDLGCGPGFWVIERSASGCHPVIAADLTHSGLGLLAQRCRIYAVPVHRAQQNAESLGFADGVFSHVNCPGVIHHTPDTDACVREIARVLAPGGTAVIAVYYRNLLLRVWPILHHWVKPLARMGGELIGRGRGKIFEEGDTDELVRLCDGRDHPIGKSCSKAQFRKMLEPHLEVEEMFPHFFPARSLPFRIPNFLHRMLDHTMGFMIYARVRKRPASSH